VPPRLLASLQEEARVLLAASRLLAVALHQGVELIANPASKAVALALKAPDEQQHARASRDVPRLLDGVVRLEPVPAPRAEHDIHRSGGERPRLASVREQQLRGIRLLGPTTKYFQHAGRLV
jgi:hypothetical protein